LRSRGTRDAPLSKTQIHPPRHQGKGKLGDSWRQRPLGHSRRRWQAKNKPIEVATRVGITERAVQRIIQDLESAGFIQRQKVGRQNQYQVMTEQPLRHPIEAHRKIGDLLKLING